MSMDLPVNKSPASNPCNKCIWSNLAITRCNCWLSGQMDAPSADFAAVRPSFTLCLRPLSPVPSLEVRPAARRQAQDWSFQDLGVLPVPYLGFPSYLPLTPQYPQPALCSSACARCLCLSLVQNVAAWASLLVAGLDGPPVAGALICILKRLPLALAQAPRVL